ncbi:MAG: hypothetical protein GKS05_03905 [Nitrospirales bacterium]|nr:hypothetical protein [Nitrospirales bacterium]
MKVSDNQSHQASENKAGADRVSSPLTTQRSTPESFLNDTPMFVDLRPKAIAQHKLTEAIHRSPQMVAQRKVTEAIRQSSSKVVQRDGLWDEVSKDLGQKPQIGASDFAESLTTESSEFSDLRKSASKETMTHHGKELEYKAKPKKGGGTSEAYFKDGTTFFNMEGHPAMILSNVIFETANAAQSGRFLEVEKDYQTGAILGKDPSDYGVTDLGDTLDQEYARGGKAERRSIIQERFEWDSFLLAKPTFLQIKPKIKKEIYFAAFDHMLQMKSFETYYETYGHIHRGAVEGVLKKIEQDQRKKKKCFLTTACVEAKGLPDDCEELRVLRAFRDGYLHGTTDGPRLIEQYYDIAPGIVEAIAQQSNAESILDQIYQTVRDCVALINAGQNENALRTYKAMVLALMPLSSGEPSHKCA